MVEWLDRKKITDVLEEAYNDVLIWNDDDDWNRGIKEGIYIAMSRINAMSSANKKEAERKKGKWFLDQNGQFRCSNCERVPVNRIFIDATLVYDVPAIKEYMKFCPMCGADMRSEKNE